MMRNPYISTVINYLSDLLKNSWFLFPNSRQIIDTWIYESGELFDDVIIEGSIPITEISAVQLTSILKSVDEKSEALRKKVKEEVISSAFKELGGSLVSCNVPSKDVFFKCIKRKSITVGCIGFSPTI